MAAPTFVSGAVLADAASGTSFSPFTGRDLSNCDLALVFVGQNPTVTGTTLSVNAGSSAGWTKLGQQQVASGNCVGALFYKIAPTASETLTIDSTQDNTWSSLEMRVAGANSISGTSANTPSRDPPSHDAGAVRDHLWLEFMVSQTGPTTNSINVASSGYSNLTDNTSGNFPSIGAATKDGTASQTENPGTYSGGIAPRNAAFTVAVWSASATTPVSAQGSSTPVSSRASATGKKASASSSLIAALVRQFGWSSAAHLITTAPVARRVSAIGKPAQANTTPAKTILHAISLARQAITTSPAALSRALSRAITASTAPGASLNRQTTRFLQAILGSEEHYGPELIYNGAVGATADGWSLTDGATAAGDGRIHWGTGSFGPNATPTVLGTIDAGTYELTYTISDFAAGTIRPRLSTFFTLRSSNGTFTERKTIGASTTFFFTNTTSINDAYIDDVSLRQVTSTPATISRAIGKALAAISSPTTIALRQASKIARATASTVTSIQRGIALTRLVSSAAVAAVAKASSKILQAILGSEEHYGPELLYNGAIGPAADGWTLTDGAAAAGDGRVHWGNGALGPNAFPTVLGALEAGGTYELVYTVSGYAVGTIRPRLQTFFTLRLGDGTFTERKTISSGAVTFQFNNTTATNDLYFDDVSLRQVIVTPSSLSRLTSKALAVASSLAASAPLQTSKFALAVASTVTSIRHGVGLIRQTSAAVVASLSLRTMYVRAFQAVTSGSANLVRQIAVIRTAATAAVAARVSQTGKLARISTAPIVSKGALTIGKPAGASTAPVASRTSALTRALSFVAAVAASLFKSTTRTEDAETAPVATETHITFFVRAFGAAAESVTSFLKSILKPAAVSTVPATSLRRDMSIFHRIVTAPLALFAKLWTPRTPAERSTSATPESRIARASPES